MIKENGNSIKEPSKLNLSYLGRINFEIIDSMLYLTATKLEAIEKNINVRKRAYSVLMECSQNLCFHTNKSDEKLNYDPASIFVSIENDTDAYVITTKNYVRNENVCKLTDILERLINKSHEDLRLLYNEVLTNNQYSEKGGGGLGLIDIARKGKIDFVFDPVDAVNSYFTLTIKVYKEKGMTKLTIKSTPKTPDVSFDATTGVLEIKGMSCAEHALNFYKPVYVWLDEYMQNPAPVTVLNFKLKYFNTSSAKCILQLLEKVEKLNSAGKVININWYFITDDEQMIADGENYSAIIGIPFNMIELS